MKVVILAGGFGTRISEESHLKPKPMIEIGDNPILWHIMKYYSHFGFNDFIICCGYKGYKIKEYFANYYYQHSDVTFDFSEDNKVIVHNKAKEPWKVTVVDTGLNTQTGGRIKRVQKYLDNEPFMLTYGDGVSDVNFEELLKFHKESNNIVTMTAIQPGSKFGVLDLDERGDVLRFEEKSKEDGGWINAGFMVVEPEIFYYLDENPKLNFEHMTLRSLAKEGKLGAYKHYGFWQCMDTLRDKLHLEALLEENEAPWVVWED
ncbi:MAG: glucose-1-phosphate cytidylyltransferase [Lachnospiraceae bacterium]|nr:glucose-1-phosphate cytidylyltransferase [Lachnospiraceae bacterium]